MSFFNKLFGALDKLDEVKDALDKVAENLQNLDQKIEGRIVITVADERKG